MTMDRSHLTDDTQEPVMQETEKAAMLHLWQTMGYGGTPGLPNYESRPVYPAAMHTEPINRAITLTQPTPLSLQEALATSQETVSRAMVNAASGEDARPPAPLDRHLQDMYQSFPLTPTSPHQHSGLSPAQPSDPPFYFVSRPDQDYEAILQAMATGNFDIPIFGAAGTAFMNRPLPGTPMPQNKKRKCAETPHDTESHEFERETKKPARREKADKLQSFT
ncbi:hypothetical protein ACET3X_006184 [Alternaria dauci]|uniref:Uncharacterized protein n=1 Tax=Alternaria dauci TaxID=48095 RepID=A0ABR3UHJ7_9PLEO